MIVPGNSNEDLRLILPEHLSETAGKNQPPLFVDGMVVFAPKPVANHGTP